MSKRKIKKGLKSEACAWGCSSPAAFPLDVLAVQLRSIWIAAQPSGVSAACPSLFLFVCRVQQVINKAVKHCRPQYRALGCTTSDWPSTGLSAPDQSLPGPVFQPVFNPLTSHLCNPCFVSLFMSMQRKTVPKIL